MDYLNNTNIDDINLLWNNVDYIGYYFLIKIFICFLPFIIFRNFRIIFLLNLSL